MKKLHKTLVIAVLCDALIIVPAHASFMDDFYTQAGAAVNVTPAQVRQTGSGGFITGGSVIWRVPNRDFTPLLWQPPGIKAGCGGIDMYLGSFGFANTSQFVDYMRNVGQNALGLFFKMALKAMSPELESAISELTAEINKINAGMKSSCQTAQGLIDGRGITQTAMNSAVSEAKQWAVGDGTSTDAATADQSYSTNLFAAEAKVNASSTNSGGNIVKAVARNYVWAAMNSGNMSDMPDSKKMIAMSIIGAYGTAHIPGDTDHLKPVIISGPLKLKELVGEYTTPNVSMTVLDCGLDTAECLEPTQATQTQVPFARIAYNNLTKLRNKIMTRTALDSTDDDALRMLGMTQMPVWRVLELTSTPSMNLISDTYIQKFSNVIGYEMGIHFLQQFTEDVEKTMNTTAADENAQTIKENYKQIQEALTKVRADGNSVKQTIDLTVGGMQGMVTDLEHLEKTMYFNLSTHLNDNVKFAAAH